MAKKKRKLMTEEERMESARLWWRENGKFVIIGAVLGIAVVLGWRGWEEYQVRHARDAATLYYQLYEDLASQFIRKETEEIEAATDRLLGESNDSPAASTATSVAEATTPTTAGDDEEDGESADDDLVAGLQRLKINYDPSIFEMLKERYADTVYPAMAYLEVARVDIENGDLEQAADKLTWVAKTTTHPALKHIADIRRARVLIALDRFDDALQVLNTNEFPQEIEYLVEEARGDALVKKGDMTAAATAYRKAIELNARPSDFLQMKLDDLGLDSE